MEKLLNITLHEEEINIIKEIAKHNNVKIHKEIITEKRTFVVPVNLEVLVIEKSDFNDGETEIIKIPLFEEQVEFTKNLVRIEDVNVYKNKYEEIQNFDITLSKEILNIETVGNVKIHTRNIQ
jgi:uncharacterized protein (TIGR02271 family)